MHSSRRAITLCGSALVAGGALLLVPAEASAADSYNGFSGGINLSFSVGAHPAFGVSLDLRYTHYIKGGVDPTYGGYDYWIPLGAFAQFGYLRGGAGRFSFGGHGGALAKSTIVGADGELGITYRTDYPEGKLPGGVGLHV